MMLIAIACQFPFRPEHFPHHILNSPGIRNFLLAFPSSSSSSVDDDSGISYSTGPSAAPGSAIPLL